MAADKLFPWSARQRWTDDQGYLTPEASRWMDKLFKLMGNSSSTFQGEALRAVITQGTGSPEGVLAAPVNGQYLDTSTNQLYVKKTGTGNTGWIRIV